MKVLFWVVFTFSSYLLFATVWMPTPTQRHHATAFPDGLDGKLIVNNPIALFTLGVALINKKVVKTAGWTFTISSFWLKRSFYHFFIIQSPNQG